MKRFLWLWILLAATGLASAENNFTLSGYLKNETSLRAEGLNGDLTKLKSIAQLAGEYRINDELVFFTKAKYAYDAAYALRDKLDWPQHYLDQTQRTYWLRDCYLDYLNGPWFLRLGKQQVAWGQADGISILDRVQPVDLSEYWLPDLEDIRIPLWMLNINYAPGINSNLQILIIPDFEGSTSSPPGAPFTTYSYARYTNWKKSMIALGGNINENVYYPGKQLENATFGLQWSDRIGELSYTLNYLNGFYYSAYNTTISLGGVNFQVDRAFKRYRLYGGSFNRSFTNPGLMQGITLRGDLAVYNDEPFYIGDPTIASAKRIARWNNVFWLIGADRYVFTNWQLSCQFAQYILENAREKSQGLPLTQQYPMNAYTYGFADQVENIFTVKLAKNFLNDRVKPEVLWSFTDDAQGRVSPKVNIELKNNLLLTLGVHYFYGNMFDSNGQYRDQSQAYVHLKYSF